MTDQPLRIYTWGYGLRGRPFDLEVRLREYEWPFLAACAVRKIDVRLSVEKSRNEFARGGWLYPEHRPELGNLGKTARWVKPEGADSALDALADYLLGGKLICLICCETDYRRCHRTAVAEELAKLTGGEVIHL